MNEESKTEEEKKPEEEAPIQTDEFDSDKVHVTVKTFEKCRIKMIVDAKSQVTKEARKKAIKDIAKEVSIPGFRKGKAPAELIEKKYHSALSQGWDKAFADTCFSQAQKLAKVPLLNGNSRISYFVSELTEEKGTISFDFERDPVIPEMDYKTFKLLEEKEEEVSDEKVEETVKRIQMFYAQWNQIEDRPV